MTQTLPWEFDPNAYTQHPPPSRQQGGRLSRGQVRRWSSGPSERLTLEAADVSSGRDWLSLAVDSHVLVDLRNVIPIALKYPGYIFTKAVPIQVGREEDKVSVMAEDWNAFGLGDSLIEALSDLASMLVDRLEYLESSESSLSRHLLGELAELRALIKPENNR